MLRRINQEGVELIKWREVLPFSFFSLGLDECGCKEVEKLVSIGKMVLLGKKEAHRV
jgi:hypothetical protein